MESILAQRAKKTFTTEQMFGIIRLPMKSATIQENTTPSFQISKRLFEDVRSLIEQSRSRVAQSVNSELVMLYWKVGQRVRKDILGKERSPYGKEIVQTVSGQLVAEYGKGFSRTNLFNMIHFAEVFPKQVIVATLSQQLGWSHFVEIIPIEDSLKRDFYSEMCRIERWSVRTLRVKIDSMLFERTALSKKPKKLIQQEIDTLRKEDQMTPDLVFRDPYFLDFLGLKGSFNEKDVESAILRELEKFQAGDKGQMEFYLRWLEKYEKREGEESPLGLILCSEKNQEQVSLLKLDHGEIRVAEYFTELPSREIFEKKLRAAISIAKEQLAVHAKGSL